MPDIKPRVAVVADDDEFFRLALVTLLTRQLAFDVVLETASLDEALERLGEETDVDVALFDLSMPGMESPASLGAVRECAPDVKVVVVSASVDRLDIMAALLAGSHGYVPKSLGAAGITRALAHVLGGEIYVPPLLATLPERREGAADQAETAGTSPPVASRPADRRPSLQALTPRQRDVLALLVEGKSNKEIARVLKLSEGTAKIHVAALLRGLRVPNRAAAAVTGARLIDRGPADP